MHAIALREFGGPETLVPVEVDPPRPAAGEVILRTRACGVCYLDTIVRQGMRSRARLPAILGHEIAGEVVEVGSGVTMLRTGDHAITTAFASCGRCIRCRTGRAYYCPEAVAIGIERWGGYAEFVAVSESSAYPVPPSIPWSEAAAIACPIGTALDACRKARLQPGETALVTGAGGGLGLHAIQAARVHGARVLAVTSSPGKAGALRDAGADEVLVAPDLQFARTVRDLTGGGAQVVIENVGSPIFEQSFRSLATNGRMVFIGELTGQAISLNAAFFVLKDLTLCGATAATREALPEAVELVRLGRITPRVQVFPVGEAARVHRLIAERQVTGRAVLLRD
jgi:D-arabinose 1-dehydrogenase-like Zn-dependent alcohol dehydrogenase